MKDKLLVTWNASTFKEIIFPILDQLSVRFRIFILFENRVSIDIVKQLEETEAVEYVDIVPYDEGLIVAHLFMRDFLNQFGRIDFNMWLTLSTMLPYQRYISDCLISKECITVCSWHQMTYIFMRHQTLAKNIIANRDVSVQCDTGVNKRVGVVKKILNSKGRLIKILIERLLYIYPLYVRKKIYMLLDRVLLPWIMVKRTFRSRPYDEMTQIGCGNEDYILFSDEVEVFVHSRLLKRPTYFVADYSSDSCVEDDLKKKNILCVLSGWEYSKKLPDDILSLYVRDLSTVLDETNAESIHLRPHPSSPSDGWAIQLLSRLIEMGFDVNIVGCEKTIREVACNYLGVVGFASAALRDARASSNKIFVVGFSSVSKYHSNFRDPQFAFGKSEGIGWISDEGGYDPKIFMQKYEPKNRRSLLEIVYNL